MKVRVKPQMRQRFLDAIEADALGFDYVFVNAGQRGLQLKLDPQAALRALGAKAADVTA